MIKLIVKANVSEGETKEYSYEFDQPVVTLGRLKENDISLPVSTVSGYHSQILREGDNDYLIDRGSINGTYLNGVRLVPGERKLLNDGDTIRIQTFEIYYSTGLSAMNLDQGATVQLARQMVMEVLGSWESQAQEKPKVIIMGGPLNGRQFEMAEGKRITIGRKEDCDVVVEHPSVSRKHAEISFDWSGAFIHDLKSSNGVFVNDVRIVGSHKLRDRDEVRVGQTNASSPIILVFSNPAEALLYKIESQMTESAADLDARKITDTVASAGAEPPALPEPSGGPPPIEQAPAPQDQAPAEEPEAAPPKIEVPPGRGKGVNPIAIAGAVIVLLALVAGVYFFMQTGPSSQWERIEPNAGSFGDTITLFGKNLKEAKIQSIQIRNKSAPVLKVEPETITVRVPEFQELPSLQNQTEIVVQGEKDVLARFPFVLRVLPKLKSIDPVSAPIGSEVRLRLSGGASNSHIFFGSVRANSRSTSETEIIAIVPQPSQPVPSKGLKVPVALEVNNQPGEQALEFTVLPAAPTASEKFRLAFQAKEFQRNLGFSEYAVETNFGPLLVMVAPDLFPGSKERAEEAARQLNQAVDGFMNHADRRVVMEKEEPGFAFYADGGSGGKQLLLRLFPEDAQAYSKLAGRPVDPDELAVWWNMLLSSHFKVFVQIESPQDTGILSAGGTVLEQIYNFYPQTGGEGKYYKGDLVNSLTPDQKTKLADLSLNLPKKLSTVAGKWRGIMANILYSNISEQNLELSLSLQQSDRGTVSGTAEVTWKIVMGSTEGNYQNVAYRSLGKYTLSGTYRKTKASPVEFWFVEKDGRRLNFVGRIEGDILGGNFVVSSTGEEGAWTVRLQK